jgi:WD40 repeat protein
MSLRTRSGKTTIFLGALLLLFPSPFLAQDLITVTELDDAVARSQTEEWYGTAETGEEEVGWQAARHGLEFLLLFSPDSRFLVFGEPVDTGLDVVSYRLFLVSLEIKRIEFLSDMALGATFAPTSDYLLISTGPNPALYNLATRKATPITQIKSGVENYPVWVSAWSADGKVLTLYQQQRFDNSAEPRAWTLQIE